GAFGRLSRDRMVGESVAGRPRTRTDRDRLLGQLRPDDGRHLTLVPAPARYCGRTCRDWQLSRRNDLAAGGPAFYFDDGLARDAHRYRLVLPHYHTAAFARDAPPDQKPRK